MLDGFLDWAAVMLPTIISIGWSLMTIKPPPEPQHKKLKFSLIVVGFLLSGLTLWQQSRSKSAHAKELSDSQITHAAEVKDLNSSLRESDNKSEYMRGQLDSIAVMMGRLSGGSQTDSAVAKLAAAVVDISKLQNNRPTAQESVQRFDPYPNATLFAADSPFKLSITVVNGGAEKGLHSTAAARLIQAEPAHRADEFDKFAKSVLRSSGAGRELGPSQLFSVPTNEIKLTKTDWDDVKSGKRPLYTFAIVTYSDWRGDRFSETCYQLSGEPDSLGVNAMDTCGDDFHNFADHAH
jgi:hypothetical protein